MLVSLVMMVVVSFVGDSDNGDCVDKVVGLLVAMLVNVIL